MQGESCVDSGEGQNLLLTTSFFGKILKTFRRFNALAVKSGTTLRPSGHNGRGKAHNPACTLDMSEGAGGELPHSTRANSRGYPASATCGQGLNKPLAASRGQFRMWDSRRHRKTNHRSISIHGAALWGFRIFL
ncbi:hypothetical protein PoB_000645600 [Plakobranchus ocellatus]|uniref:Uncharacterized protein n=1 Tax=Plakobranchus ocellatus TaxID=259542 RepID=A0AAV3Y9P2_9GAST|nr:hypothetical protein PoB_000645600 [Plakobranchus ocellatus]